MLILLKGASADRIALLVDRVKEILTVPESALLPVGKEHSLNGCAEAVVAVGALVIHLLSPRLILLRNERAALSDFQAMAQNRFRAWEGGSEHEQP